MMMIAQTKIKMVTVAFLISICLSIRSVCDETDFGRDAENMIVLDEITSEPAINIGYTLCEPAENEMTISNEKTTKTQQTSEKSTEEILMRHMVKNILNLVKENDSNQQDILLHLSPKSLEVLSSWVNDENSTYNSIDAFDSIKDSFYIFMNPNDYYDREGFDLMQNVEYLKEFLAIASLMAALIYIIKLMDIDLKAFVMKVTIFLFAVSIPWNWLMLYKKAIAKKQAALINSVPEHCQSQKLTLSVWLHSLFTIQTKDPCHQHYESILVDPLWEISPTQALSETIIRFFVQPAEHVGSAISISIRSLLEHLPVQMWPIALIFLFSITFFILIATFQYSCTFPLLGGFEPFGDRKMLQFEQRLKSIEGENSKLLLKLESYQNFLMLDKPSANVDCEDCKLLANETSH
ncbi:MAG: chloride channel CLIC like 1 [Marteilia pararefringens]